MNFKFTPPKSMYLVFLLIIPILSIVDLILTKKSNIIMIKKKSLFWSVITLILYIIILIIFNKKDQFQFNNIFSWINNFNSFSNWGNIFISNDGISIFFIGLSVLLVPICILMSWNTIKIFEKEFYLSLNFILLLLILVFSILDILGFYIMFEGILIPMFLIIGIWGSREQKIKAAFYFFFYTLIGSLLMLISIFKLYSLLGTTNYQNLLSIEIPYNLQYWLFIGFFMSLAVKIPMVPFHIWLPQAHVEAPISGSVLLAGILLKLGGYGFIRFSYPIFPLASEYFSPFVIILSIIAIVYASFTTLRQTDIKRLIAYSSVSHMGLVTLVIFTNSFEGLIASILMMLAHGLVSSGLFMTSSIIYTRHHSRTIKYFRGLAITMPIFSIISLILILANIGFPLTFNFIAEFFSILTIFSFSSISGILTCVGLIIGTIYSLYFYNRIWFGQFSNYLVFSRDLIRIEFHGFLPLIILTIILGFNPNFLCDFILFTNYLSISF